MDNRTSSFNIHKIKRAKFTYTIASVISHNKIKTRIIRAVEDNH